MSDVTDINGSPYTPREGEVQEGLVDVLEALLVSAKEGVLQQISCSTLHNDGSIGGVIAGCSDYPWQMMYGSIVDMSALYRECALEELQEE